MRKVKNNPIPRVPDEMIKNEATGAITQVGEVKHFL